MNMKHRRFSLDGSVSLEEGPKTSLLGPTMGSRRLSEKRRKSHSPEVSRLDVQELTRSPSLRYQITEEESIHYPDDSSSKNNFVKNNKAFHKHFRDVPAEEKLTEAFTCSLQKEVLYHGKLYVSINYVCFYSSVLLKDTKVMIPVSRVKEVKKQSTALSILSIRTADGEKYSFVSLRNRQLCYNILMSVCTQTQPQVEQGESGNSSPHFSSGETRRHNGGWEIDTISSHSSMDDSLEGSARVDPASAGAERGSCSTDQNEMPTFTDKDSAESWVWSITDKMKGLLHTRERSNFNILVYIYLILLLVLLLSSGVHHTPLENNKKYSEETRDGKLKSINVGPELQYNKLHCIEIDPSSCTLMN
ncbi:hypothetical protein UPYG_G00294840 [Umbra pygmaea]|uniref:GRAM domain-containing protein n=1 Tax=Umbra pygmaea TaxID=75934 RepID=A0ABD0WRV5_UMBPY